MNRDGEIVTIDTRYLDRPEFAAAYLVSHFGHGVFVDNNTAFATPRLISAAARAGLEPRAIDFIVVTHVHLDHSGGTQRLLERCPNATVLCHPRAVRHLTDPTRLVASAKMVYGEKRFAELYGEILPIDAARVQPLADAEVIDWRGRQLVFLQTRGHAKHHICMHDPSSGSLFSGDAFGLAYPHLSRLSTRGVPFVFPSSSPTDFEPEEALATLERIVDLEPRAVFPTHYGAVPAVREAASEVRWHLERYRGLLVEASSREESGESLVAFCRSGIRKIFEEALDRHGIAQSVLDGYLEMDASLNAAGIAHAAERARSRQHESAGAGGMLRGGVEAARAFSPRHPHGDQVNCPSLSRAASLRPAKWPPPPGAAGDARRRWRRTGSSHPRPCPRARAHARA
jgi:glyoxylase-like metal-dependent hydrolase (beta-lactamase superfamily II)